MLSFPLSSINSACADEMKETFCEVKSVKKLYLRIAASLLQGESMLWIK